MYIVYVLFLRLNVASVISLAPGGFINGTTTYKFTFPANLNLSQESYSGLQARVRHLISVKLIRSYGMSNTKELPLWIMNVSTPPEQNNPIKMEVGIEDCLHIEFEYAQGKYHLQDVVVGKIYFLLVRNQAKYDMIWNST